MITTTRTDTDDESGLMGCSKEERRHMPAFFFAAVGG
jgi:hypothetical protein